MSHSLISNQKPNQGRVSLAPTIFLLSALYIIFLIYFPSLNREWQFFDERLLYNEGLFPIPNSFTELLEVIRTYAFNYHIDSQNAFFSNIITVRSNIVGTILNILVSYLFQTNVFFYHILQISLHLINSTLAWFIFYKVGMGRHTGLPQQGLPLQATLFTCIWALHPTNIEAVLLITNWTSLLTYSFCLGFFLYTLTKTTNNNFKNTASEIFFISFLFLISIMISEYSYTLPFVLFFLVLAFSSAKGRNSIINSIKLCFPYFLGLIFFAMYYLLSSLHLTFDSFFARLFWLTPQIFIHFLKLFFYPKELSVYQTNLITLASSDFHPYLIFALVIFLSFLLIPVLKNKTSALLIIYSFLFSLFPFLHIVSPTYCIIAERYCYFPLFIFLFFLVIISKSRPKFNKALFLILLIALIPLTTRTIYRLNDWKDSFPLYLSAAKCNGDNLYKGQIYSVLGYYFDSINKKEEMKKYMHLSIKYLEKAFKELKCKNVTNSPLVLKAYGLDTSSLITTCAFSISNTKFIYFQEKAKDILQFYEPYIKNNLTSSGCSQLDLYAKLLIKTNQEKKAESILKLAREKYPFSSLIIYTLSNLYLKNNELDKSEEIIQEGYKYYPSYKRMLIRMIKLCELKGDHLNLAKYEYLLGLRAHSKEAYQRAVQLYLSLNKLTEAKVILDKLLTQDKENPVTYLLLSKYYSIAGDNNKTLEALNKAHRYLKNPVESTSIPIHKSILLSLISFNSSYGNSNEAKKYIREFEQFSNISKGEMLYIEEVKKKLN